MNTQQTPPSSLTASPSHQSQLRQSLKVKWLAYYRDNRDWLTRLGVWINDRGERRPSSSFILATLSVLEPRLTQLMPIVVDLNSNADRVVKALGLNFTPDDELKRAIANGLLPAEQELLTGSHQSEPEQPMKFLPSMVSPPFTTNQMTIHQSTTHPSMMHRRDGNAVVSHAEIATDHPHHATLQDSVDLYLGRPSERYSEIAHYQEIEAEPSFDEPSFDEPSFDERSPHEIAAQTDETCSGMGQGDPFQSFRNIDIRI